MPAAPAAAPISSLPGRGRKPPAFQLDPARLRYPKLWDGLCVLLPLWEGIYRPREWFSGLTAPTVRGTPTWTRDNDAWGITNTAATIAFDLGITQPFNIPANQLTVWVRHKWSGVSSNIGSLVQFGGGAGDSTWLIATSGGANTFLAQALVAGGTRQSTAATATAAPTDRYMNYVLRWTTGAAATLTVYEDGGAVFIGPQSSAAVTGPLAYVAAKPLHVLDDGAGSAVCGTITGLGVWSRRLSDGEVGQLVSEPNALLQEAPFSPELLPVKLGFAPPILSQYSGIF